MYFLFLGEGVVRIYRNYGEEKIELLTAWRASDEIVGKDVNSGLVCEWHQQRGFLYTSGMSESIKCWDAEEEVCVQV